MSSFFFWSSPADDTRPGRPPWSFLLMSCLCTQTGATQERSLLRLRHLPCDLTAVFLAVHDFVDLVLRPCVKYHPSLGLSIVPKREKKELYPKARYTRRTRSRRQKAAARVTQDRRLENVAENRRFLVHVFVCAGLLRPQLDYLV